MKLSEHIMNIGRPVAFYPSIARLTGTISSALFLCQLLYWSDKTKDGWIYKTSKEIYDETSLSYTQQRTARERLKGLNLIEERNAKTEHQMYYRVKQDILDSMWNVKHTSETEVDTPVSTKQKSDIDDTPYRPLGTLPENHKKGNLADGLRDLAMMPGIKKTVIRDFIEGQISVRMRVHPSGKKWTEFIEYALERHIKDKQYIDTFIDWWLVENPNPVYWSADKMKMLWPQAFITLDNTAPFVVKLPEVKEEKVMDRKTYLKLKNKGE